MPESNEKLPKIELDYAEECNARIYVRWNFKQVDIVDELGNPQIRHQFDQKIIWWWLPLTYVNSEGTTVTISVYDDNGKLDKTSTRSNIVDYINMQADEIITWACNAHSMGRL